MTVALGSEEEAAYAVAVRPELLEIERPGQFKSTMQAVSNSLCSVKDASWLVVQTMAPPSVKVCCRAWCHEDVVGEYQRMEGVDSGKRPVYKKPAAAMQHLGSKA